MTIRIGQIPYLNSVLFYHDLDGNRNFSLEPLVPRQLSGAAVEDAVDAGPVPLVTCWQIEDRYEPLDDFCIATTTKAGSILLFSKVAFHRLDGARVGVTNETSTSVQLLKVLMTHVYGARPAEYVHLDWPNNDAFLLIGDDALIHRRGVKDYPYVADLGEVWHGWQNLPFVFARWMVRREIDPKKHKDLTEALGRSLDAGWRQLDEIIEPRASHLGMSNQEMRQYLEGFRFRMTDDEHEAVKRFRKLNEAMHDTGEPTVAG